MDTLFDVLRYAYLGDGGLRTVSRLARTCKLLYFEGSKFRLGEAIYLSSDNAVASFCTFMLSHKDWFPMLRRQLTFSVESISIPTAALASECMAYITDLVYLEIYMVETLLRPHPQLSTAISRLNCLQELKIDIADRGDDTPKAAAIGPGREHAALLRTFRSPVRSVTLSIRMVEETKSFTYMRNLDPIWLLAPFSKTLQTVRITAYFAVDASTIIHRFPFVTTLALPDSNRVHYIRPFVLSFPALRSLSVTGCTYTSRLRPQDSLMLRTGRHGRLPIVARQRNKQDQVESGSWTVLEDVCGPSLELYKIGFTCQVRRVHLVLMGGGDEPTVVRDVLKDTRPTSLRVMLMVQDTMHLLERVFGHPEAAWSLTCLELKLNVDVIPFSFKAYFVSSQALASYFIR